MLKVEFFSDRFVSDYISELKARLKTEVEILSDRDIEGASRDEWLEFFVSKYSVEPIVLYPDNKELDLIETDVQEYNGWHRAGYDEPEYFTRPGVRIGCSVPYTGDPELFRLCPSVSFGTTMGSRYTYDADSITKPGEDGIGYLVMSLEQTQRDATPEGASAHFDTIINNFEKQLENIKRDIGPYNKKLRACVEELFDDRVVALDKLSALRQGLNIPLNRIEGAPMARPIPTPKKRIKPVKPSPQKGGEPQWCIGDSDYTYINDVIENFCATWEVTPGTYANMKEEALRDSILAMLNTHYKQDATGETFRVNGKTDILLQFDNRAAFVAECKMWSGVSGLRKAIAQLFSYTTWRDTKVSIVLFNKRTQGFAAVLGKIDLELTSSACNVSRVGASKWLCTIPDDSNDRTMHVAVFAFNLFVPA